MIISFFSNFLNHHQLDLCKSFLSSEGVEFYFVSSEPTPAQRTDMGYSDMNEQYDFVIKSYECEHNVITKIINDSDFIIFGSSKFTYLKEMLAKNKFIFRYNERPFRNSLIKRLHPLFILDIYSHFLCKNKNVYLLSSSAFSAFDFSKIGLYKNKSYKWGYFPTISSLDSQSLFNKKVDNSIIWCGRFIDCKHPEKAINLANYLNNQKIDFKLTMVGDGPLRENITNMIRDFNIEDKVELTGSVEFSLVRDMMEKSEYFIFTSDYDEGWGAVLNEAMSSRCICIASSAIGSVPFLIKNNINGVVFNNDSDSDFLAKSYSIIKNKTNNEMMSLNAFNTIDKLWNAKNAANSLIELYKSIVNREGNPIIEGPCSKDMNLDDNWFNNNKL